MKIETSGIQNTLKLQYSKDSINADEADRIADDFKLLCVILNCMHLTRPSLLGENKLSAMC